MYDLRELDRRDDINDQLRAIDDKLTVVRCLYGSAATPMMKAEAIAIIGRLLVEQSELEAATR